MMKLSCVTLVTGLAMCVAAPQWSTAQEEEQDRQSQERQQGEEDEDRQREQQRQQEQQREREQQQREQQQREQQQREQQQREQQQREQQQQRQGSQFDQQYQEERFGEEQRFQRERQYGQDQQQQQQQRFQDQRSQQDQRFGQDQQFQGSQQRLELGAQLQDYGDRLVVSNVGDQSLAAQIGLEPQDIIVSVDGRTVRTQDQFQQQLVVLQREGGRVPIVIIRDGERQTVYFDVDRYWQEDRRFARDRDYYRQGQQAWLGVILDPRYEDYTVVRRVYPGSAADEAGIREGDWILGVNNRRIQSPAHLSQIIDNMRPGEQVDIQVARRVTRNVSARLGEMSDRQGPDRFARGPQDRFGDRFEQRFQSEFRSEDEFRSGFRGVDEQDVLQEESFQQDQESRQDQNRGFRNRFNPEQERGLRDRLDRDRDRNRLFDNRDQ